MSYRAIVLNGAEYRPTIPPAHERLATILSMVTTEWRRLREDGGPWLALDPNEWESVARRVHGARRAFPYQPDPPGNEELCSPLVTLRELGIRRGDVERWVQSRATERLTVVRVPPHGPDCEDHAALGALFALLFGLSPILVPMGGTPDDPGHLSLVVAAPWWRGRRLDAPLVAEWMPLEQEEVRVAFYGRPEHELDGRGWWWSDTGTRRRLPFGAHPMTAITPR